MSNVNRKKSKPCTKTSWKELVKDNLKMATELDRKQQQEIKEKVIKMASKAAKKAAKKSIAKARIREAFQSIDSDD